MSPDEKSQSKTEQLKGKLKEAAGKVTGNEEMQHEGKAEKAKGSLRETKEDVKDSIQGTFQGLRGDNDQQSGEENQNRGGDSSTDDRS